MELEDSQDLELILDKQDAALKLLAKLRMKSFPTVHNVAQANNQRRQYKRWAAPESISVECFNDGWLAFDVIDVGRFKIVGFYTTHDSTPSSSWVFQRTIRI